MIITNMITTGQATDYLGISKSSLYRREKDRFLVPDRIDTETGYRYYSIETLKKNKSKYLLIGSNEFYGNYCFSFIDLFSGIGGIRVAFENAGGNCVFSSEIDKYCCQTYEHIFGEIPSGDITQIPKEDIPKHDVLVGGFPCQPFSIAGVSKNNSLGREHGFEDKAKGTLFFDIAKIIKKHRPKAFFLENVKNLKSHDKGRTWQIIKDTLEKDLGYTVYSKVMDAKLLVPQHRERIFIVGFKEAINFEFPVVEDLKPKVKDILEENVPEKYTLSDHSWRYLQDYAEKHRQKGNGFGYGLVDIEGVTRTLSARYYKDGSEILIPQEGRNPRRLTPVECARLQGFPKKYEKIVVSDTQAYKQFGNAVAVPLVTIVAKEIIKTLARYEYNKKRKEK